MLQTDINMENSSSQQQQHNGVEGSNSSTSLKGMMNNKQMTNTIDPNNNEIENGMMSNVKNNNDAYTIDSNNNNAMSMMNQQNGGGAGGSGSASASHDSLHYSDDQQHDHEANSLINEYCNGGPGSKTNLIVNYLPQNMTQDEIKELFSSIGPVESCKLIKDKLTGQSLGYAFVNFVNQEDADKAIYTLNGMRLQNKTIKVSLARPSSELIKGANLYICGLPKDFSQSDLERMFHDYGTIISSKILTDPKTGESKGVGFVRFDKRIEAESAIEKLNGKMYENIPEPLVVKFANSPTSVKSVMGIPLAPFIPTCRGFFQPYRSSSNSNYRYSPMSAPAPAPPPPQPALTAAYCTAPLDPNTTTLLHHQTLAALNGFATTASLPATPGLTTCSSTGPTLAQLNGAGPLLVNGTSAGNPNAQPAGVVSSAAAVAAAAALASSAAGSMQPAPPTSLSSHSLSSINYAGWCIFVYNLGPESDESLLWQLFGPFGAVQSVKVIRDMQSHKCKGFGFVTMTNYEEALNAINCLNGYTVQNRILQVSFKTSNKQMF